MLKVRDERLSPTWLEKYWATAHWGEKAELLIPSVMTVTGLISGVGFVMGDWGWGWAVGSLLCDFLDGKIARALHATTEVGARMDYLTDVALAVLCAVSLGVPWILIGLVPLWAVFWCRIHFSGRALLMLALVWTRLDLGALFSAGY